MRQSSKFASILTVLFLVTCAGIVSAAGLQDNRSLEEKTSRPIQKVQQQNLEESAKGIVTDYFNAIIKEGDAGGVTPLIAFSLGKVDISDSANIKVSVDLKYKDDNMELPSVDYSVVRVDDKYQVQKQVCIFDAIPGSPTKGTASCSKIFIEHENGLMTVPGRK
ncbi:MULTISPECIES: hypothetical protein [unclassified Paenibacillus]|uniref:hypothetical protein n=1 Tax=unclassified Paenibacillus TaxID=185978 RepID=UPI002782C03B|nr:MULTISPECIES: hypothetical protein [unclassified Paenibacillus]MDQ0896193.1 hypothetical protein [Paenibacillus sp. V4I7]MDQ0913991.1 hypothetical protein [Paenibacillus sp. V4I5]